MSDQPKKQELPPINWDMVTPEMTAEVSRRLDLDDGPAISSETYLTAIVLRERQLLAALSDNEALRTDNEAKDARIAELEARHYNCVSLTTFVEALEGIKTGRARLKSVEGIINCIGNWKSLSLADCLLLLARIREAVK